MKVKIILLCCSLFLGMSIVGTSFATPVDIYSNTGLEGLGSFMGSVDYYYDENTDIGQLTVELTNTSPEDNSGYITGLAFLFPDDSITVSGFNSTNDSFEFLDSPGTSPFTGYDSGAALGADWLGGGSPKPGIGVGETATFYFNLTGTGIASLGATDFASTDQFALVRFRGFANDGSDKVPSGGGGAQVPEPATVLLLGSGLLGFFGFRKKFWKSKK